MVVESMEWCDKHAEVVCALELENFIDSFRNYFTIKTRKFICKPGATVGLGSTLLPSAPRSADLAVVEVVAAKDNNINGGCSQFQRVSLLLLAPSKIATIAKMSNF